MFAEAQNTFIAHHCFFWSQVKRGELYGIFLAHLDFWPPSHLGVWSLHWPLASTLRKSSVLLGISSLLPSACLLCPKAFQQRMVIRVTLTCFISRKVLTLVVLWHLGNSFRWEGNSCGITVNTSLAPLCHQENIGGSRGTRTRLVSWLLVHYRSQWFCCFTNRVGSYKRQIRVAELATHKVESHCQRDCSYNESRKKQKTK